METFQCQDFNKDVAIQFEDGSVVFFCSVVLEVENDTLMVFTEHCGYHNFPLHSILDIRVFGVGGKPFYPMLINVYQPFGLRLLGRLLRPLFPNIWDQESEVDVDSLKAQLQPHLSGRRLVEFII